MKIPETFVIGAVKWTVSFVPLETFRKGVIGQTDHKDLTIKIGKELVPAAREMTFIHELLHILNAEWSEDVIELVSALLHQFIEQL